MIAVRVLLFARFREIQGSASVDVELPAPACVLDLRNKLSEHWPQAALLVRKSAFAIGLDYVDDATPLADRTEVALIPPVSGG